MVLLLRAEDSIGLITLIEPIYTLASGKAGAKKTQLGQTLAFSPGHLSLDGSFIPGLQTAMTKKIRRTG